MNYIWMVTHRWIYPQSQTLKPHLQEGATLQLLFDSSYIIDFHQGAKRPKRLSFEWSHIEYFIHGLKFRTKPFKKFYLVAFVWLFIFRNASSESTTFISIFTHLGFYSLTLIKAQTLSGIAFMDSKVRTKPIEKCYFTASI